MLLPTRTKLRIARLLNRLLVGGRALAGLGATVQARRGGFVWALDLNEGIDLAIYLGLYQKLPRAVLDSVLRAGACAIDIGANIGAFTLPLSRAVGPAGQVVSIEPTSYAFDKLKTNLALNGIGSVLAAQCALGDGGGQSGSRFYSRWPLNAKDDGFHAQHQGKYESAAQARCVALDDLISELRGQGQLSNAIAFVKLDVDGHELEVIKGARRLLTEDRPVILMEVAPHIQDEVCGRFEELVETLHRFGYRFETGAGGKPVPDTAEGLRAAIPHGASIDAIIRPGR